MKMDGDSLAAHEIRLTLVVPLERHDVRRPARRALPVRTAIGVEDDPVLLAIGRLEEAVVAWRVEAVRW